MKKMMMVLLSLGLVLGAAAQRGHGGGGYHGGYYVRPHISVGFGYYSPFGPYGYYSPFYMYPYGPYYAYPYAGFHSKPSQLAMNVQDIKNDYADRIWSAKHDTRISHKERRKNVRALKRERDKAVQDEIMNYYKHPDSRSNQGTR
ncbi:MAG: hypothetical protein Q8918_10615 [Bacteroidota bacterium]|nr:hypothetical protein [Bacteroidota bacterium]MDP4213540.1 hypothetical protein [Bacteroidota bacterium]MDP4250549.1 hypothetical protein [Bacteroidota bacterium]